MPDRRRHLKSREYELGLDRPITRRDFVNATAIGTGTALLWQHAPLAAQAGEVQSDHPARAFDGFAGVGDYSSSNGNTWEVVQNAHAMRDGKYRSFSEVTDTGERYDVVIVGGGFAGMGAAHRVMELGAGKKSCLVLDNHRMFGGEAKRNEFLVNGTRLMGPQGSNDYSAEALIGSDIWDDLGLPRNISYSALPASRKQLASSISNYTFHLWGDNFESHGFYFPDEKRWVTNPWGHELDGVPWPEPLKQEMIRWRHERRNYYTESEDRSQERWLDSMSYEHYLTEVMGLPVEVARYADPILAAAGGLGSDVTSAYMAFGFGMPGFQGMQDQHVADDNYALSATNSGSHRFPGGNDGILRAFVKRLVPDAIEGGGGYENTHNGAIRFQELDRTGNATRIRLGATTVAVEQTGQTDRTERVAVTFLRDDRLYRVYARSAVIACGSWTARHIVRDLPREYDEAMRQFYRSPMLVVNVALTNWRALYKLGYTAASWRGGTLGFSFNLSPPMQIGSYAPAFDPDQPAVLTYYVPFVYPGLSVDRQGQAGRYELLSKPYREYERIIRAQLTEMLGPEGFDPRRDIAGIILNRWGHAYVDPYPGFYFGRDGKPAPSDVLREPYGRLAFAHSELRGHQYARGAVEEGRRAVEQLL